MESETVKGKPLTKEETKCLLELVEKSKIIITKTTNATNNKLKNEEWIRLAERFNATATSYPRTPTQLRLKWENLKKNARKRSTKIRMNHIKTGGGPADYIPPDDILDRVTGLLGSTASGFTVPFGGDSEIVECDVGGGVSFNSGDGSDLRLSVVEVVEDPITAPLSIDNSAGSVVTDFQVLDVVDQNFITPIRNKKFTLNTPKMVRKKIKLEDKRSARDEAIAEYFNSKKQYINTKVEYIVLDYEKIKLEKENIKLENEKIKLEIQNITTEKARMDLKNNELKLSNEKLLLETQKLQLEIEKLRKQ